jgi:DNA-binding response OmpR family regulator
MTREPEILFVDDEDSIRITLPLTLQSHGFKVTAAATVREALRLISERQFDILISDMNIERAGDGFTVVSAMRSTQPKALRFILTGYPDIESALQALRQEVDDYLIKPTEVQELVSLLRSKLEKRTLRQEVKSKPLREILSRERDFITERWLELAKQDADLSRITLSDSERRDHVPRLVDVAVKILAGSELTGENRSTAEQHGSTRKKQGYVPSLVVREAKLLQDSIAACIQTNLFEIEISTLIPDMIRVFGIVQTLLEESMTGFQNDVSRRRK